MEKEIDYFDEYKNKERRISLSMAWDFLSNLSFEAVAPRGRVTVIDYNSWEKDTGQKEYTIKSLAQFAIYSTLPCCILSYYISDVNTYIEKLTKQIDQRFENLAMVGAEQLVKKYSDYEELCELLMSHHQDVFMPAEAFIIDDFDSLVDDENAALAVLKSFAKENNLAILILKKTNYEYSL